MLESHEIYRFLFAFFVLILAKAVHALKLKNFPMFTLLGYFLQRHSAF